MAVASGNQGDIIRCFSKRKSLDKVFSVPDLDGEGQVDNTRLSCSASAPNAPPPPLLATPRLTPPSAQIGSAHDRRCEGGGANDDTYFGSGR